METGFDEDSYELYWNFDNRKNLSEKTYAYYPNHMKTTQGEFCIRDSTK